MTRMGFIQDELDLKLLVMYIMARAAGPITFLQLYDIALCDAGVDYFSLNQAVQHLVTTGNLQKDGDLFSPTEKGRLRSGQVRRKSGGLKRRTAPPAAGSGSGRTPERRHLPSVPASG